MDVLALTKLFCPLGFFFSSFRLLTRPSPAPALPRLLSLALLSALRVLGVYLGAMGKGEANDSQWLLISTICSALGPLISERKSNMWRESDRQKLGLANRPIVC